MMDDKNIADKVKAVVREEWGEKIDDARVIFVNSLAIFRVWISSTKTEFIDFRCYRFENGDIVYFGYGEKSNVLVIRKPADAEANDKTD
jgi:hypothetical protein